VLQRKQNEKLQFRNDLKNQQHLEECYRKERVLYALNVDRRYKSLDYNNLFLTIIVELNKQMEVIQTFPNGTTIEFGQDSHGHCVHRVCSATGAMCRLVESHHIAVAYAAQYEENYAIKPPIKQDLRDAE
jgi:hypothetical protein